MTVQHQPVVFECEGSELVGIIEHASEPQEIGVLIVTGGPQYRAGSHRQFVSIARKLASEGVPTMRFDYRGTGDSAGPEIAFHQTAADLQAAIGSFVANAKVKRVVLWGLCDAASACLIYGHSDRRVAGLILLNPWVRTEAGLARTYVKHYYLKRIISSEFWSKLITGRLGFMRASKEFFGNVLASSPFAERQASRSSEVPCHTTAPDFLQQMQNGFEMGTIPILFMLCGNDLTASEFIDYAQNSRSWRELLRREYVRQLHMPKMDHTFSTAAWREEVISNTVKWVSTLQKSWNST